MTFSFTTTTRGPLFDGRAARAMDAYTKDTEEEIAQEGADVVRSTLGTVLRHPTGYYRSQVHAERDAGGWVATDGGVVYGPWLEGTSRRNGSTRFKGYHTFRRVTQRLQSKAAPIAERVLDRYIGRLQ